MATTIQATIRLYDASTSTSFDFGVVDSIKTTYSASVTQTPKVIYGYSQSLCLDTGVSKSYEISFNRINPINPSNETAGDTARWSNAKWYTMLKESLDRWQVDTDGYKFSITMDAQMKAMFPDVDRENVYVTSISLPRSNSSIQAISGTLSLTVGSLTQSGVDVPDKVQFNFVSGTDTWTIYYPSGEEFIIPYPRNLIDSDEKFVSWKGSDGGTYHAGDIVTFTSGPITFTAKTGAGDYKLIEGAGTGTIGVTGAETAIFVLFGAGGGGASGDSSGGGLLVSGYGGGGGGGGGMEVIEIEVANLGITEVEYTIGAGGEAETEGGDTFLTGFSGIAHGGKGGDGTTPGDGGVGLDTGRSGGQGGRQESSTQVQAPEDGAGDFGGTAGASRGDFAVGGGGGGSVATGEYTSYVEALLSSLPKGGNGGGGRTIGDYTGATDGTFGCGGGGGGSYVSRSGAKGGDGFIIYTLIMPENSTNEGTSE